MDSKLKLIFKDLERLWGAGVKELHDSVVKGKTQSMTLMSLGPHRLLLKTWPGQAALPEAFAG